MRKLVTTSLALLAFGSISYADNHEAAMMEPVGVSVSGSGNFGVKYDGGKEDNELTFHHEFDIKFTASGTTDSGIEFGGEVSIDNTEGVSGSSIAKETMTTINHTNTLGITNEMTGENSVTLTRVRVEGRAVVAADVTNDGAETPSFDPVGGDSIDQAAVTAAKEASNVEMLAAGDIFYFDENDMLMIVKAATFEKFAGTLNRNSDDTLGDIEWIQTDITVAEANAMLTGTITSTAETKVATSGTIANHASVYVKFGMHTLTIGSDLDAGDTIAGGLSDIGFDGIDVDDLGETLRGQTATDIAYDGDFGVAKVRVSYGTENDSWAIGINGTFAPVTVGLGFDSKDVMSVGGSVSQGPFKANAYFGTDSDTDEMMAGDQGRDNFGIEGIYSLSDATSVKLVYAQGKMDSGSKQDAYGIEFSHSLGGGATLIAGVGQIPDGDDKKTVADLGISMKF